MTSCFVYYTCMKTRKFEIEWQLYKTYLKSIKDLDEKLELAERIFRYFTIERSEELAYNVINWAQGLAIALRGEKKARVESLKLILDDYTTEKDSSFGKEAIIRFVNKPSSFYKANVHMNTRDLLVMNIKQNLAMCNKWLDKNYIHKECVQFLMDSMEVVQMYDEKNALEKRIEIITESGEKSTHRFLY